MIPNRIEHVLRVTMKPNDTAAALAVLDECGRMVERGEPVEMSAGALRFLARWARRGVASEVRWWYFWRILAGCGLAVLAWVFIVLAIALAGRVS